MLSRLVGSIRDYVSEGNSVTYAQLVHRFGEPEEIASEYVNAMEAEELVSAFNSKRKVNGIVFTATALALLMWAGFLVYCYVDFANSINGTLITEGATVVERIEYQEGEY